MPRKLSPDQHALRLSLYNQQLNDREISERIGITEPTVQKWRNRHDLHPISVQARILNVPARPERERELMRDFLSDLIRDAKMCDNPNLIGYIDEWRRIRRDQTSVGD